MKSKIVTLISVSQLKYLILFNQFGIFSEQKCEQIWMRYCLKLQLININSLFYLLHFCDLVYYVQYINIILF